MQFTQEQYKNATEVSIMEYLKKNGYELKKKGREWCLKEHNSFNVNEEKNVWNWNSKNIGGGIIELVCEFENKTLVEAVLTLSEDNYSYKPLSKNIKNEIEQKLEIPIKNEDNRRVQAYLYKRGIDPEITNHLIKKGDLYEERQYHNICFVGRNRENKESYVYRRSTLYDNSFKGEAIGSKKEFAFKSIGNNTRRLFVFESPIDLLSHMTISKLKGNDFKQSTRISLGGVKEKALEEYLDRYKTTNEIILFLDNDKAGKSASKEFIQKYSDKYQISAFFIKGSKDLNEFLVKNKDRLLKNQINLSKHITKMEKIADTGQICIEEQEEEQEY